MKPRTGPGYFPSQMEYDLWNKTATVSVKKAGSIILRSVDVWGLAYYNWLTICNKLPVDRIIFNIEKSGAKSAEIEAFKRRVSYLNLNNSFELEMHTDLPIQLYTKEDILKRPKNELLIPKFKKRNNDDTQGRLEKDFQVFLAGGQEKVGKNDDDTTYERLGVLGIDFYQLKRGYKLIREFPTGIFDKEQKEKCRLLPTYYIDLVSFNKYNAISIIELKLNDSKLEVIAQIIDYALFALCYKQQIIGVIEKHIGKEHCPSNLINKPMYCYVANNHFHPKFDAVAQYYAPRVKSFDFKSILSGIKIRGD